MFKEVFYFLKGYVIIKIYGKFPERVLNVATNKNILCWDIKSLKNGISFKVSAKNFSEVKNIAETLGCTLNQTALIGAVFTAKRHKKRQALLWGMLVFVIIVFVLLSLLWDIRITGLETIDEQTILTQLSESGIKKGRFLYGMDSKKACEQISLKNDKIAWIGIELRGSCALVEVVERVAKPEIMDMYTPSNIISDKNGVVMGLEIKSGEPAVKIGDAVLQGQLLVSGVIDSAVTGARLVPSDGDIFLKVWHEKTVEKPLIITERELTGNKKTRIELCFDDKIIPLYFDKTPFEIFDKKTTGSGILRKAEFSEVNEKKVLLSKEQALSLAKQEFEKELLPLGEILNITYTYEVKQKSIIIHFTAEVKETAGEKREIERDTNGENPAG